MIPAPAEAEKNIKNAAADQSAVPSEYIIIRKIILFCDNIEKYERN